MPYRLILLMLLTATATTTRAQVSDSIASRFNFHFQLTTVTQHKLQMSAPYTGANSLIKRSETQSTLTSTLFIGTRLWNGAAFYFNPEIAGGSGISSAHGIADFTNGEAFRVGDPAPTMYTARCYFRQYISLGSEKENVDDGFNQVAMSRPTKYISVVLGKFSIADFFDNNSYSHDPRSQFFNWGIMSNGAWDYPANVRGYTWGAVIEYGSPFFKVRAASVLVPKEANGNDMDMHINKASSSVFEIEKPYSLGSRHGIIRLLAFYTQAHMGNYDLSVEGNPLQPDITSTRRYGRTKTGVGFNVEQELTDNTGMFIRGSWNDGKNETWAFTEIDRSVSAGISGNGMRWKRPQDQWGIATVVSGISSQHARYLAAGGYGFIIGDGQLKQGKEWVTEFFYRLNILHENLFLTPNYQYVVNPAYNTSRGPAHVFSLRVHVEF